MPMPAPASTMRQTSSKPVTRARICIVLPRYAAAGAIRGQTNEGSVADIGQRQHSFSSKRVPPPKDQNKRVVAKWKPFDCVGQSGSGGNPNVGRTGRQRSCDIGALPLLDLEADRRIVS